MGKIGRNEKCPCGSGQKFKKCCLNKKTNKIIDTFFLNKNIYEKQFIPNYKLNGELPKTFFECTVVIPFHIPAPDGITSTISTDCEYFSFRFDKIIIDESSKYLLDGPNDLFTKAQSKIHMMVALDLNFIDFTENLEDMLNFYFDSCLMNLNDIIIAYIASEKDIDCHYLTKEMLPSHTFYRVTNLQTWESQEGLFLVHSDVPYKKSILSPQQMSELSRLQNVVIFERNPFINVEAHIISAKRYFKKGFYQEAVIYAQISIDVLIRQLYKALLKEVENKTDDEILQLLETNFMKIVKSELSRFLGGSWDVTKSNTSISEWYNNTYQLRNKVVHTGKIPSFSETENAITSAIQFRLYIVELIASKKNIMPLLSSYFVIK